MSDTLAIIFCALGAVLVVGMVAMVYVQWKIAQLDRVIIATMPEEVARHLAGESVSKE